jgi:phosphopantetheinyl transferase (holo-ACP synthase)
MTKQDIITLKIEEATKILRQWLQAQIKAEADLANLEKELPRLTDSEEDQKKKEEYTADRYAAKEDIEKAQNAIDIFQEKITFYESQKTQ